MDKYEIENGQWKVKTAQEEPHWEDAGWWTTNHTALRSLNLQRAEQIFALVYGNGESTDGQWVQYLKKSIEAFQYLDMDYKPNIEALIEDLEEVRQVNKNSLNAMRKEKAPGQFEMGAFNPSGGKKRPSRPGEAGQSSGSEARQPSGRSQRTPSF